jgi:hypothetical protein
MGEKIQSATILSRRIQNVLWKINFGPIIPGMVAPDETILHVLKMSNMLEIQAFKRTLRKYIKDSFTTNLLHYLTKLVSWLQYSNKNFQPFKHDNTQS